MTTNQTLASNANHNYYANELRSGNAYYGAKHGSLNKNAICAVIHTETSRAKYMVTYVEFTPKNGIYDENGDTICTVMTAKEYRKSATYMGDIDNMECNSYIDDVHGIYGGFKLTAEEIKKSRMFCNGVMVVDEETYERYGDSQTIKNAGIVMVKECWMRDDVELSGEIAALTTYETEYDFAIHHEENKIVKAIAEGKKDVVGECINNINMWRKKKCIVSEFKTNLLSLYMAKNKKENQTIKL